MAYVNVEGVNTPLGYNLLLFHICLYAMTLVVSFVFCALSFLMKEILLPLINLNIVCRQPKFMLRGIQYHLWEITLVSMRVLAWDSIKVHPLWVFFLN